MNSEFFDALKLLEKEKGINIVDLLEKIKAAITIAVKKHYGNVNNILIDLNIDKKIFSVSIIKNVVENVTDCADEILIDEALKYDINAKVGSPVSINLDTQKFGRIAALSAKHIIKQGIREGEKNKLYSEFKEKEHTIVSALVNKVDPRRGNVTLSIGQFEIVLPKSEQIPNENLVEGIVIKVYISEVIQTEKGPQISISRTSTEFVKKLFEMEVPEIKEGIIEIKSVAREAGSRTKIAVISNNSNVDSVGSCVGARGLRVNKIVKELYGEKIDIVKYSDDFVEYISNSLSPATITCVIAEDYTKKECYVIVPEEQLSLAIGNKGQNVRLSAKLTGWKIDIKPEYMLEEIRNSVEMKQQQILQTTNSENNNSMFFSFDEETKETN